MLRRSGTTTGVASPLLELGELCERTGVTARTVRYYIQQGLLRSPGQSGPGAKYDQGHLARLMLIRRLQHEHLPLAEIRKRLQALDDAAVGALLQQPSPRSSATEYAQQVLAQSRSAAPAAEKRSAVKVAAIPAPPLRSQWERVSISPDVELHVRRPLTRDDNRLVERLIQEARRILSET